MKTDDFKNGTYQVGKVVGVVSARVEGQRTSPPERYTEHSLLEDMTSAHKFSPDASERAVLFEITGLGTSRTRPGIIKGLISRGLLLVESISGRGGKKKGVIVSSQEARMIAKCLPPSLTSVATTAKWELGFRLVEQGKATPQQMQAHLDRALVAIVDDAKRRGKGGVPLAQKPGQSPSNGGNSPTRRAPFGAQSPTRT